jgi:hypothetical protein
MPAQCHTCKSFFTTTLLPSLIIQSTSIILQFINHRYNLDVNKPGRKKRKYIKEREKLVREKFEEDIRNFTKSQGHLFVDLINRETGGNCYKVIKEVKSGFVAFNWQRIGLLFGYNLKESYDSSDPENADIELILSMIKNEKPGYLTRALQ